MKNFCCGCLVSLLMLLGVIAILNTIMEFENDIVFVEGWE